MKYFSFCPEDGFNLHATEELAKSAAEHYLDQERWLASEGWSEDVEQICWGVVKQSIVETENRPRTEDDPFISSEFDTVVDYGLKDV